MFQIYVMGLSTFYLVSYNIAQAVGWGYNLFLFAPGLAKGGPNVYNLYTSDVDKVLKVFQTLAFLEVLHAAFGVVKSNTVQTLAQVFSRVYILWLIIDKVPASKSSPGIPLLLVAWTLTEIVRYSFYALQILSSPVYVVTWLRYTLFIVLYPIGVLGEMWTVYSAQPVILEKAILSVAMPNIVNMSFSFYHMTWLQQILWPLGLYQLYTYMFRQRSKVLGGQKTRPKTS